MNELIGIAEAAKTAGVAPTTMRRIINRGEITAYKMGKTKGAVVKVYRHDLLKWIEGSQIQPGYFDGV